MLLEGRGYEVWKTKTDKNPRKIPAYAIKEYVIKEDTFKILFDFMGFSMIDAKIIARGKVNLYSIEYLEPSYGVYVTTGPAPGTSTLSSKPVIDFVLEDPQSGVMLVIPKNKRKIEESLAEFLPLRYVTRYGEVKGKIKYKSIPDVVKLYNSKN